MILPIECDDAVDRLRDAVVALGETGAPVYVIEAFVDALNRTNGALQAVSRARRDEDVEVRHIESQMFPWTEEP